MHYLVMDKTFFNERKDKTGINILKKVYHLCSVMLLKYLEEWKKDFQMLNLIIRVVTTDNVAYLSFRKRRSCKLTSTLLLHNPTPKCMMPVTHKELEDVA